MTDRRVRSSGLLLAGVLLLATALRVPGLFTDFWLDEIWTLKIVLGMDSAWDVFREVRHSNNHHLNTLWFYWLGDLDSWIPYRLPALVFGVASVALAWRIGRRHGPIEAFVASLLCASSYLLVHYSSEARGYAGAIFFALASFVLVDGFRRERDWGRAALFWLCAAGGFLSHLMFLHAFVAAGVWLGVALWREGDRATMLRDGLRLFALPALGLLAFYWLDIRLTKIGEGPVLDAGEVFVRAFSYALGGPPASLLAGRVAVATVMLFAGATFYWQRTGRDEWIYLVVVIFVSPALSFAVLRPEVFFVRYFLLGITFGLVALAAPLAWALARPGPWRIGAAVLLAAILLGNGLRLARFYEHGRGDYLAVMRLISESAGPRLPTVSGDHRFRIHTVIRFYNRYLPPDRRLAWVEQRERPDWLLLHRIGELGAHAPELANGDTRDRLVRVAPYSDLSGWHWLVYRRQD